MTKTKEPAIELLFDADTIQRGVRELGDELHDEVSEDLLLVSLLSESVVFVADLVRAIQSPVRFEFIQVDVSPRGEAGEIMQIEYPIPFELEGSDLLLVRDLTTSGVIEGYLVQQFLQLGARRVRVVSLLDLPERRTTDFEPDYRLLTRTGEVGTLVGYGLKHGGRFGNLPYIGQLL
jgi:hypoxanthine phosphoribosyltransferase